MILSKQALEEYSLFLRYLLVGLADESISVVLVCPGEIDVDFVACPGVEVFRHPAIELPLMNHFNKKILLEKLDKFGPDLLHSLSETESALTKSLARRLDVPYLLMVNSLSSRWGHFSLSSKRLAGIIVPAKSIASYISKNYPSFSERIEQINLGTFAEEEVSCFAELNRLVSIVIDGSGHRIDELDELFGAIRHLAIDGQEFVLAIMGKIGQEKQLRQQLGAMGLSQTAVIVPQLQSWRVVLAAGDIFVRPRPSDAFSPLLLEAMSVGAVVAGCKGGVDELLIDGQTAVVFDPDDEISIYDCLKKLFDSRQFARDIAAGGQKLLRENNTVSGMISQMLHIYRQAKLWYPG